ncbi:ArsA family ATPase [Halegenticoccus tardaugens]|uniref:ArsA family ATPase n=1 Tax=Halegenticoccus tardaugens TaxID=2071624 RepID=UPI00100ABFB7|nr:TRC40/GET3/ArsA family transport-energizing ATPase [Halegenticoccus tardaugens]
MAELDVEPVDAVDEGEEDGPDAGRPTDGDEEASEIPVEAVTGRTDLPSGVDAPEYVLYGGKGGVGKTTMAAATALASAAGGTPTLVVSTDPAHSLSDTLETEIPATPTRIRDDAPLFAAEIDPDAAMEDGLFGEGEQPLGGMGEVGEMFDDEDLGPLLGGTMPGADEAAAMRQLLEYLDDPRFERVVVDTAPTGHTLRLLQLPEMVDSMIGRVVKLRQRFGGVMQGVKGMFGGETDAEGGMRDLDALAERIERLRAVLRDPEKTDFRVVMIPEEMSVVESERLIRRLDGFDVPVETVVVNRVMEDVSAIADVGPEWIVAPDLESCEFCQRRWGVQQKALRTAAELFRGRDVKRVPLLADEVQGEAALRVVAACLD